MTFLTQLVPLRPGLSEAGLPRLGIARVERVALRAAGIDTLGGLLHACADADTRAGTARDTGIEVDRLLRWARLADLLRVRGLTLDHATQLLDAGVPGVAALARCRVPALSHWLARRRARAEGDAPAPTAALVQSWVEQARRLPVFLHD